MKAMLPRLPISLPVPYKSKGVNLALSVDLVFGNKRRDIPKDVMPDY